jgi:catechol 2,3-dioxygenase-like lactoylglutathione lyase family enzyme
MPATDFDRTVAFYRTMGFTLIVHSPPCYARFECPDSDSTFSLHSVPEPPGDTGVGVYFGPATIARTHLGALRSHR